jgi:transcriptional regulator with XRE-family HTH domain
MQHWHDCGARARRGVGDACLSLWIRSKAEMGKRSRDPCDTEIAKRVGTAAAARLEPDRARRQVLGVTFQQVQKYERGTNRISAGRLYRIADMLDVPVSFFYDGFDERAASSAAAPSASNSTFFRPAAPCAGAAFTRIRTTESGRNCCC